MRRRCPPLLASLLLAAAPQPTRGFVPVLIREVVLGRDGLWSPQRAVKIARSVPLVRRPIRACAATGDDITPLGTEDAALHNVVISVPAGADASGVSDFLLDLGFLSATVSLGDGGGSGAGEGFMLTDAHFDRTGQLDLSNLARGVVIEALSATAVDASALGATLADIFSGDGERWLVESTALPSSEQTAAEFQGNSATDLLAGGMVLRIEHDNFAAFGDGGHSSTRLCLQQLERLDLTGAIVLDFGAGTGVLGLAALNLGARHATMVENHPASLAIAAANVVQNGQDARVTLVSSLEHPPDAAAFDVVVSNMPSNTLMGVMPLLVRALTSQGRRQGSLSRRRQLVLAGFPAAEGPMVRDCVLRLLPEPQRKHAEGCFHSSYEAGRLCFFPCFDSLPVLRLSVTHAS